MEGKGRFFATCKLNAAFVWQIAKGGLGESVGQAHTLMLQVIGPLLLWSEIILIL